MTRWGSVRAVRTRRGQGILALAIVAMLTVSGCGGKSGDSKASSSSSKSASPSSSSSPSPSSGSARPVKAYCVPHKFVSQRMGAQFIGGQPKMGNGAVECDYIGSAKSVLIYTAQNFPPSAAANAFHGSMANYKRALGAKGIDFDLEKKGLDAGIGEGSKYIIRSNGISVIAYDSNGTIVFAQLNSKKAEAQKNGFFQAVGSALNVY